MLLALLTFGVYEQASYKVLRAINTLEKKRDSLQSDIATTLEKQKKLKLEVASISDPQWIELQLIKGLGVVPEGYQKIYFEEGESPS